MLTETIQAFHQFSDGGNSRTGFLRVTTYTCTSAVNRRRFLFALLCWIRDKETKIRGFFAACSGLLTHQTLYLKNWVCQSGGQCTPFLRLPCVPPKAIKCKEKNAKKNSFLSYWCMIIQRFEQYSSLDEACVHWSIRCRKQYSFPFVTEVYTTTQKSTAEITFMLTLAAFSYRNLPSTFQLAFDL